VAFGRVAKIKCLHRTNQSARNTSDIFILKNDFLRGRRAFRVKRQSFNLCLPVACSARWTRQKRSLFGRAIDGNENKKRSRRVRTYKKVTSVGANCRRFPFRTRNLNENAPPNCSNSTTKTIAPIVYGRRLPRETVTVVFVYPKRLRVVWEK